MDAQRFDTITKVWGGLPRRRVVGGLAAGTLSTLFGLGRREASAQSCRRGKSCPAEERCVHRICLEACDDPFFCVGENGSGGSGCTSDTCFCAKKPRGGGVCLQQGTLCGGKPKGCRKQSDCPTGKICATGCCSPKPKFICQLPCTA